MLLAVAYELKSPGIGQWTKSGWMEGWKNIGCVFIVVNLKFAHLIYRADSIPEMTKSLVKLREQLGSDFEYFEKVYKHTFDFARNDGQRSLGEIQISYIILHTLTFAFIIISIFRARYGSGILGSPDSSWFCWGCPNTDHNAG